MILQDALPGSKRFFKPLGLGPRALGLAVRCVAAFALRCGRIERRPGGRGGPQCAAASGPDRPLLGPQVLADAAGDGRSCGRSCSRPRRAAGGRS